MEPPIAETLAPETEDETVTASPCLSPEGAIFSRYQKAVLRYTGSGVADTPENRAKAMRFHDQGITFQEAGILHAMALVEDGTATATPALQEAVDSLPPERLALMYEIWRQGRAMRVGDRKKADPKDILIMVLGLAVVVVMAAWAISASSPHPGEPAAASPVPAQTVGQDEPVSDLPGTSKSTHDTKLVKAQELLKQKGLYKSKVDGIYGPGTKAALKAFQAQNGLAQTGTLDDATFDRLRDKTHTSAHRQAGQ